MNDNHRKLIEHHMQRLIDLTDYDVMINALLKKQVLTPIMAQIIEQDGKGDKMIKLYQKLTHRGPEAFSKLLEIFKENNYEEAHKLLSSSVPAQSYFNIANTEDNNFLSISNATKHLRRQLSSPNSNNENQINNNNIAVSFLPVDERDAQNDGCIISKNKLKKKLEPYEEKTSFTIQNLEVKKAMSFGTHPKLPVYSMKSRRRGVFFFVNIINFQDEKTTRKGAERDHENLVTLFREMNFTIFYYEDLTRNELMDLLRQLVDSEYLKKIDSFFLCIQTHGDLLNNQTVMEFSDGSRELTENIIAMFSNSACPSLVQKPKVFLFPFCRGKISDKLKSILVPVIETDGKTRNAMSQHLVPSYSDILVCYGTVPGFMTHRDIYEGSWYVRALVSNFAQHACDCHLEELLKMVGMNTVDLGDPHGRVQVTSTETRGFHSLLYLNPKIFD